MRKFRKSDTNTCLNSDQLDLILGKNCAGLLRIEPKPSTPKTMDITQI